MIKLTVIAGLILLALLSSLFFVQHRALLALHAENDALRAENQTLREAAIPDDAATRPAIDAAELDRLRRDYGELLRLRGEATLRRKQAEELKARLDQAVPPPSMAISNQLQSAQQQLDALSREYGESALPLQEQRARIQSLERSAVRPNETLALAQARADLAALEVSLGPAHHDREGQRRFVESLEQSTAAGEPADLAQAKAELAKLRVGYGDAHPAIQSQLQKIASLTQ